MSPAVAHRLHEVAPFRPSTHLPRMNADPTSNDASPPDDTRLGALRRSEERYRALVDAATSMVWCADEHGQVVDMPFWPELTGQTPDDALGDGWTRAIHPADLPAVTAAWQAANRTLTPYELQYRLRVRDGSYRWFRARVVPVLNDDGSVREWVGLLNEVDRMVRRDEGMRFLAEASATLSASLDERTTLDALARLAVDHLADGAMITLVTGDGHYEHVTTRSRDGVTGAYAAETERMYPLPHDAPSGYPRAIRTGEPELVPEGAFHDDILPLVAVDATHLERLRKLQMYSAMVVPLVTRGSTVGAITLVLHGPERRRAFDTTDLALATELARRAALALDNARLFAAERRARAEAAHATERLQAVADAARAFAEASTDPSRVVDELARILTQRLGDFANVRLLSADERWLEAVASHHVDPALEAELRDLVVNTRQRLDMGITGRLVKTPDSVILENDFNWRQHGITLDASYGDWLERRGLRAIVGVPMRAEGRIIGTVLVGRHGANTPFDPADAALVQDLADRAALIVERARIFAAERSARAGAERSAELTKRLQEITASFARTMSMDEVAGTTLSHGLDALRAEAGVVYVADETTGSLDVVAKHGIPDDILAPWLHIAAGVESPMSDAVRTKETVFIPRRDDALARYPAARGAHERVSQESWVAMPLLHGGRVLGAVALGFEGARDFSSEDRLLVDALAHQCAQAMERARLLQAERVSKFDAERANHAKSELLAKVSHETRQPVHATIGWIDTVEMGIHGPVTDAMRDALRRMKTNQMRLLTVLNDLLNISRIDAGKLELRMRPVVVAEVVDVVESAVTPQMQDKGIAFEFCRPDAALTVHADLDQVIGILTNLLSNAAKFTPAGGSVRVDCHEELDRVVISVTDTGIGIAPEHAERVFEPFYQVESGFTRTTIGTGLGLAISREAARAMGGDITVESRPGYGSRFSVVLRKG